MFFKMTRLCPFSINVTHLHAHWWFCWARCCCGHGASLPLFLLGEVSPPPIHSGPFRRPFCSVGAGHFLDPWDFHVKLLFLLLLCCSSSGRWDWLPVAGCVFSPAPVLLFFRIFSYFLARRMLQAYIFFFFAPSLEPTTFKSLCFS